MGAAVSDSLCSSAVVVVSPENASLVTTPLPQPTTVTVSASTTTVTKEVVWQRRDVAFLKTQEELESECQEVVLGQDVNYGATGHPCIIMDVAPNGKYALVTTVSSFRSGPHNGYQPPWQQNYHRGKDPDRFRSFVGTERPNLYRQSLCLEGGGSSPRAGQPGSTPAGSIWSPSAPSGPSP
ncbi:uncharacterized protein PG998_009465 [Apiospora kogelbergensis]|uniref:Uncharacterized protein n=1 Tax=Apiospora kogelbergensis TaxID=1337665 RepID=A0AAW0R7X7_9PEZI